MRRSFLLATIVVLLPAPSASQEDSRSEREALGRIIGVGVVLSSAEFIGGGRFDLEDDGGTIRVQHLPWHHRFADPTAKYKPWILGAIGRVVVRQPIELLGGVPDWSRFEADSVAFNGGLEIDLGRGFYVEPSAGLIYSWIEDTLTYNSPESEALRPILDGVLFNWEAEALSFIITARLGYKRIFANQLGIDVATQFVSLSTDPVKTDSEVQDTSTSSDYTRLQARVRIPLGVAVAGNDLYAIPRVTHTFFSEEIEEPLDSDSMTELNLRLLAELEGAPVDASRWRRLAPRAVGVSAGYRTADGFSGWSFGITFHSWIGGW
jgi:hypothetical protein